MSNKSTWALNNDRIINVRFGLHNGIKSDIAPCPKSATNGSEADAIASKALNDFVQSVLDEVEALPLARIPDRFSYHGVKLALGEFLRLQHCCLPGHNLCHWAGAGSQ